MASKNDFEASVRSIRILSTFFLSAGIISVMAGLVISINTATLTLDYFTSTTEALRNAAEEGSILSYAHAQIESNRVIANSLFASGIGSLLFGIGLAIVDVLKLQMRALKK